jgi:hypothetical protein
MTPLYLPGPILNPDTDISTRRWYEQLPMQHDPDYCIFMDDFLSRVVLDATNRWTVVKDGSAAVGLEADTVPGWLVITSQATTDNDGGSIQGNENWAVGVGRRLWFETAVKLHDADDCDFAVGLCETFATDPENMLTSSNRICFQVNEGNASILCKTEATDVESSSDSQIDAADNTTVTLGFLCIGTGVVEFYVNRVLRATHTSSIPTANLKLAAFHISGSNVGTFTTEIDYMFAAMTR